MSSNTLSPELVEAIAVTIAIENQQNPEATASDLHRRIAKAVFQTALPLLEAWQDIATAKEDMNLTVQIAYKAGPSWCIRQGWWSGEPGVWTDGLNRYRPSHWRYLPQGPSEHSLSATARLEAEVRKDEREKVLRELGDGSEERKGMKITESFRLAFKSYLNCYAREHGLDLTQPQGENHAS